MKMKSKNYLLKNVEDYWEIINYNYDQIQYAEIKSSVVVSVYSLFFTAPTQLMYLMMKMFIIFRCHLSLTIFPCFF